MNTKVLAVVGAACASILVACGGTAGEAESSTNAVQGSAPQATAAASCSADEQTLFACGTRGGKQVALCASKDLSKTAGYVQYRFGTSTKVEMAIPSDLERTKFREQSFASTLMYAGGGGAYVRFETDTGYSYVVYTAIGRDFDEAGVAVQKAQKMAADQVVSTFKCERNEVAHLGADLFEKAGFREGEADLAFELPTK